MQRTSPVGRFVERQTRGHGQRGERQKSDEHGSPPGRQPPKPAAERKARQPEPGPVDKGLHAEEPDWNICRLLRF